MSAQSQDVKHIQKHARIQGVWSWVRGYVPLKSNKNIGFLSNTGQDPLKNYKAAKPTFNVGPSPAASDTPFNCR